MANKTFLKIFLATNSVLQFTSLAVAHELPKGTEEGSKVLHAFTHWPPTPEDTHYYFEAIFLITFLILLSIQTIQNAKKRKSRAG